MGMYVRNHTVLTVGSRRSSGHIRCCRRHRSAGGRDGRAGDTLRDSLQPDGLSSLAHVGLDPRDGRAVAPWEVGVPAIA